MNDVEEDSAQHEERWPKGWEVHVQQILPRDLVCSLLRLSRTTAGHMAGKLWQVITVQHGVWEVCKLEGGRAGEGNSALEKHHGYYIKSQQLMVLKPFSFTELAVLPNWRRASEKVSSL